MIPFFWRNDSPPRLSMGGWNHRAKDVAIGYVRWPKRPAIWGARSISLDSEMNFDLCFSYLWLPRFLYLRSDRVGSKQFSLSPAGSSIFRSGFSRIFFDLFMRRLKQTSLKNVCFWLASTAASSFEPQFRLPSLRRQRSILRASVPRLHRRGAFCFWPSFLNWRASFNCFHSRLQNSGSYAVVELRRVSRSSSERYYHRRHLHVLFSQRFFNFGLV